MTPFHHYYKNYVKTFRTRSGTVYPFNQSYKLSPVGRIPDYNEGFFTDNSLS